MPNPARYAKDLLADRDLRLISDTFPLWVLAGLAIPFGLGVALTGSVAGGLTGLLWGGAVRIFVLHHATFSINSLCHTFGRRPFGTRDQSRNLAWLAPLAFGEAWHNNHHAFPTSAQHGLGRWELDPGAWLIAALERSHLAWDVIRISPARQQAKRAPQLRRHAAVTLGLGIALVSALGTSLSALFKARGAVLVRPVRVRHPVRSAANLFRSRWFAIGWLVALLAWGLHVEALSLAPLSSVQAIMSGGLVFLAVLAERFFGFHLGRRQWRPW